MSESYRFRPHNPILLLAALLFLAAIITNQDFVFVLLYLVLGAYLLGNWWSRSALKRITIRRDFTSHAFLGEQVRVRLEIANTGWLPLAWLRLRESLPLRLSPDGAFQQVTGLGPKQGRTFEYWLECNRRGWYPLGPLDLASGDVLGVGPEQRRWAAAEYLIVYPKIVSLAGARLPSRSPMGTLINREPLLEDPSRVRGKRDYVPGDSLRCMDWKASAATGRLQVKLLEPSIALETSLVLNLNAAEYSMRGRYDTAELAIIVTASLASWITRVRQAVGLAANGADPLAARQAPVALPPRRGRANLLHILEYLARLQVAETEPFARLVQQQARRLSWGTTLILISGRFDEEVFDSLFQARRSGLHAFLVQCGPAADYPALQNRAAAFGFPLKQVFDERDLELWR